MKPPYRVPSMAEVRAVPSNGYRLVSTFSGAGGSCTGFRLAGFRALWASEFVASARETYAANWPQTVLDGRDIRDVTPEEILTATGGEIDVLEGSPPCSSFSMAGKREAGWGIVKPYSGERSQRTDDLFAEYARLVRGIQPRIFVAENVAGLTRGKAVGYFRQITADLRAAGYAVESRLLDAQWLGVPQVRSRLFILGVRDDLYAAGVRHIWPVPLPFRYGTGEALADVPAPHGVTGAVTGRVTLGENEAPALAGYALDQDWLRGARYINTSRGSLSAPLGTVTALGGSSVGIASVVHPTERRKFSIRELKALCSYPADYVLCGTYAEQWERLGRSVPPLMARAVAECVRAMLDAGRTA